MSTPEIGFFNPKARMARRFKYPPAIGPDLAPWSQTLDQLAAEYELDYYPEGAVRAALDRFASGNARSADPNDEDDATEVTLLAMEIGGWVA